MAIHLIVAVPVVMIVSWLFNFLRGEPFEHVTAMGSTLVGALLGIVASSAYDTWAKRR